MNEVLPSFCWEKHIANRLEALTAAMEEVDALLARAAVPPATGYAIRLALEELGTNVIKYAWCDDAPHTFLVRLALTPARLVIMDDGRPFDPLRDAPQPDLESPLEERAIGGLGLHMIREMGMTLRYERVQDKNLLDVHFPERS